MCYCNIFARRLQRFCAHKGRSTAGQSPSLQRWRRSLQPGTCNRGQTPVSCYSVAEAESSGKQAATGFFKYISGYFPLRQAYFLLFTDVLPAPPGTTAAISATGDRPRFPHLSPRSATGDRPRFPPLSPQPATGDRPRFPPLSPQPATGDRPPFPHLSPQPATGDRPRLPGACDYG